MQLLVVHHTPSPAMQDLLEAARSALSDAAVREAVPDLDVEVRPALGATVSDVLAADGYLLGTPANIGYISGALKHFFDTVYYPVLDATAGRPFAAYVHGNLGVEGAVRAIDTITTGLGWRRVAPVLEVTGAVGREQRDVIAELAATLAVSLGRSG